MAHGSPKCKICAASSSLHDTATVLRKYEVNYFRCDDCGFIQTGDPYWISEAYSSAISKLDVGIMCRNIEKCEVVTAVLNLLFPEVRSALDFGGGYGVLVRLLRDRGFNFFWQDAYAENLFARGFEARGDKFDFLTAFEVLEHLVDPLDYLSEMLRLSDNVLVSTSLAPEPAPRIADWWYFAPVTGQHVSIYTKQSLQIIAKRFNRNLLSFRDVHLFTRKPVNRAKFLASASIRLARIVNLAHPRQSLRESDFQCINESP